MQRTYIPEEQQALNNAIKTNDGLALERALTSGANIEFLDSNRNTPIIIAANAGFPDMVSRLAQHGANLNHPNRNDDSALHIALIAKNIDAAHTLVELGADTNLPNKSGMTGLHIMARAGDTTGVKLSLHHGGNPAMRNPKDQNRNAIDYARDYQRTDVSKVLKEMTTEPKKTAPNLVGTLMGLAISTSSADSDAINNILGDGTPQPKIMDWKARQQQVLAPRITSVKPR